LSYRTTLFFDYAVNKSAGSLSPRVKWEHLKNYEFELPDMEKQCELAKVLWAMDTTKKSYQQLLQKTDELVISQFRELMGSAAKKIKLVDCAEVLYGFPFNSKLFNNVGQGMPLIRVRDINSGFSETYTTEKADDKYLVRRGDCIVGMDGSFDVVKWAHEDAYLNQRVCKFTPLTIQKEYLLYYLKLTLKAIEENTPSTTVKHLSAKDINSMEVPIVDNESQLSFEKFSIQIDKTKLQLKHSIAELSSMYKRIISENLY